ncbi:hypothetical protein LTR53_019108, partial [Teratosphaeriaceae sp. CCFEE 6253]
ERGLMVSLQVSASAQKREDDGRVSGVRKPASLYSARDERERKREERKFVIVVTKLEQQCQPMGAIDDSVELPAEGSGVMAELPAKDDAEYSAAELPGEDLVLPVELPAMELSLPAAYSLGYGSEKLDFPVGPVKLHSDTTLLLEKTHVSGERSEHQP